MRSLEPKPLLLDVHRITLRVSREEFEKLCQDNPDLRLELTANGEFITMVPVSLDSSEKNGDLFVDRLDYRSRESKPIAIVYPQKKIMVQ